MGTFGSGRRLASLLTLSAAAIALALPSGSAEGQERPGIAPDKEGMYQHLKRAREIAGTDLYAHYVHRCIIDQTYRKTISRGVQAPNTIEPVRVFDNLYFLGGNAVTAWVLDAGNGLVMFDALNSPDDIRNVVEPGLKRFGLEPSMLRYLVITHAHGDHFGGARYLKEKYGVRILASVADWDQMARQARGGGEDGTPPSWAKLVPDRDLDIADGQKLKIGQAELTFYLTPGHTPGTVSTVFKVQDGRDQHVVGFFGGLGTPQAKADKLALIASAERFKTIAKQNNIDVLIANHQTQDQSIPKLEELRLRRPGDSNPYVIGTKRYIRYLSIQQECTRFAIAQQGQ